MKALIQRTTDAKVTVDGEKLGEIAHGYVVFLGVTHEDTRKEAEWLADKIANLRLFEDEAGKMNNSLIDVEGSILSISQFTLYGDAKKGRRPSFVQAARPEAAEQLYDHFNEELRKKKIAVETGKFGAMMKVNLLNDGPVTLMVETPS